MDQPPKPLFWVGSSKRDVLELPDEVVDLFGYAPLPGVNGQKA